MTPYNHHISDAYLAAYTADVARDLEQAHRPGPKTVRRTIARRLVQLGAWMLPEEPELGNGSILVLEIDPGQGPIREAA